MPGDDLLQNLPLIPVISRYNISIIYMKFLLKLAQAYIYSVALILLLTAVGKFIAGAGNSHILVLPDPILGLPFRFLLWIAATLELCVAIFSFIDRRLRLRALLIAWLSTCILFYRFGLWWGHYKKPCNCMGTLVDALHISPQEADTVMKYVLAYMLLGSVIILAALWKQGTQSPPPSISASAVGTAYKG